MRIGKNQHTKTQSTLDCNFSPNCTTNLKKKLNESGSFSSNRKSKNLQTYSSVKNNVYSNQSFNYNKNLYSASQKRRTLSKKNNHEINPNFFTCGAGYQNSLNNSTITISENLNRRRKEKPKMNDKQLEEEFNKAVKDFENRPNFNKIINKNEKTNIKLEMSILSSPSFRKFYIVIMFR